MISDAEEDVEQPECAMDADEEGVDADEEGVEADEEGVEYDEGSVIEDEMSDVEDIMNAVFGEEGGIYEDSSEGEGGYLDENIDEEYS